jgi:hypothetical protein
VTVHESLIALWAGQPEADLRADIAEIIARVGAENPDALADEIAHVVMQHGTPAARSGT